MGRGGVQLTCEEEGIGAMRTGKDEIGVMIG